MKVSVSTDNGMVSEHFGRCPEFTIVEVEDSKVVAKEVIPNPGHHPGFLPEFLKKKGVGVIIAGGMGQRAQALFSEQGIESIMGISGKVDEAVASFIAGTLKGGVSICQPGAGKGYGVEKTACDHEGEDKC
ncbi:dinitrogenase iron-molybdenum cofactor [Candidatus Saganbacteria bacterium CG08_land_8_20_14_0_20_45_16]|uniref:Dinitrogenase iron-molybdenum cofactor n=1 Tax=Candidatus Saganbacteria bacterium CG08_land_8_20_14_0_20_45_16 TaxID=2014293 RepID=A0A2H0XY19_UNCSA|nr:MAG: dinitrogenase iron-molybdenum cofactor [Candidatus Saganbacteria bacterium CG08_land_8_20_14_0_20_45_16]